MRKFEIFKKLMTMLVFPEDLKEKCQVLEKGQHFIFSTKSLLKEAFCPKGGSI